MNSKELFKRLMNNQISKEEFDALIEGADDKHFRLEADAYLLKEFEKEIEYYKAETKVLKNDGEKKEAKVIPLKQIPSVKPKSKKKGNGNKGHLPDAAIILLLITAAFGVMYVLSNTVLTVKKKKTERTSETTINPQLTKSTPIRQMFRMKLSDGSFVHMNAVSKITYPRQFNDSSRNLALVGEAYFDIARDEKKLFTINVKDYQVKVLGTSFNIEAYEDEEDFSVTVESGNVLVQLSPDTEPISLTKNQKLIFNPEQGEPKVIRTDAAEDLEWRRGVLRFKSTSMRKVEHMLERWYGVEINIADSSIYKKTLTGIHKNENIKSILESISYATNTKYHVENNTVIIRN